MQMKPKSADGTDRDKDGNPEESSVASVADRVSESILQGIRSGTFVPGQHLLEPDLTRRLGISRGSLREALKHLAAAGIVTLNRFRGAYISTLDRKSVLDLLDTLEPLARLAAQLAATNCVSDAQRKRMQTAAANIDQATREHNRGLYLDCRRQFYDTLIDIGGNKELSRAMPLSRTDLFRAQIETIQSEKQRVRHSSGYAKICKAVIENDPTAADRAVKKHFAGTRQTIHELPAGAFPSLEA
jgi:DNA-binding GntR family transcriptional regulator